MKLYFSLKYLKPQSMKRGVASLVFCISSDNMYRNELRMMRDISDINSKAGWYVIKIERIG